jgi:DNA polymerase-3 subunit epsilon
VVEIAAVELVDGQRSGFLFHSFVRPEEGVKMNYYASRVNGISDEFLQSQPLPELILPRFFQFIANATLVAHNALFDLRLLDSQCDRMGFPTISNRVFCTMSAFRRNHAGSSYSLLNCARHYQISIPNNLHSALTDAELTAKVLLEMRKKH